MAAPDVTLSHTIDDDITFERVRHMPRRTHFVSTHRKLTWQYDRQVKQHERDQRISHVEMVRAKTAMAEKLSRLMDAKKEVERKKSDPSEVPDRRDSASCLRDSSIERKSPAAGLKHSHSAASVTDLAATMPEDSEYDLKAVPARAGEGGKGGRRATIAEGATERASLPPHLLRRLSQFMDSTSALLSSQASATTTGGGGGGGGNGTRKDSSSVSSKLAERFAKADGLCEQDEAEWEEA